MDGCRPVSRAGRADEAAQTRRVDRDTENGTQNPHTLAGAARSGGRGQLCLGDGSLLPTSSADVRGCHVSPKMRSPDTQWKFSASLLPKPLALSFNGQRNTRSWSKEHLMRLCVEQPKGTLPPETRDGWWRGGVAVPAPIAQSSPCRWRAVWS